MVQILSALESVLTIAAIILGGIWTWKLFIQRRQRYPRANLDHKLRVLPYSREQNLLRLSILISNEGDVLLQVVGGKVWILLVKPWPSRLEDAIRKGVDLVKEGKLDFDWPLLEERPLSGELCEVEPGETDELHLDFLVSAKVEAIHIYTHLQNKSKRKRFKFWQKRHIGWNKTTFHEITQTHYHGLKRKRRTQYPGSHSSGIPKRAATRRRR